MDYEHVGILHHNLQGRYSFADGYYFTSGEAIEIYYDDMWLKGRIEYSQHYQDYYFINDDEGIYIYNLEELKARI
ncbi:DUF5348 domain-containing protein [Haloimpatiens massiliensis]|uniref:DUF5348 domain-containing protein n=1 Tax=Haloimpatiens massiliensis TaxID=1658110 RepID=UPI000C8417FE|nr:DUF5348 domain-containing protein [Haloimpatiens massiliensis]